MLYACTDYFLYVHMQTEGNSLLSHTHKHMGGQALDNLLEKS